MTCSFQHASFCCLPRPRYKLTGFIQQVTLIPLLHQTWQQFRSSLLIFLKFPGANMPRSPLTRAPALPISTHHSTPLNFFWIHHWFFPGSCLAQRTLGWASISTRVIVFFKSTLFLGLPYFLCYILPLGTVYFYWPAVLEELLNKRLSRDLNRLKGNPVAVRRRHWQSSLPPNLIPRAAYLR